VTLTGDQIIDIVKFIVPVVVAGIPPTIVALKALRQSQINTKESIKNTAIASQTAVKLQENTVRTVETAAKADKIIEKTAEIHTLANSNLAKMEADLSIANVKIEGLERLMANMIESKSVADKLIAVNEAVKSAPAPEVIPKKPKG